MKKLLLTTLLITGTGAATAQILPYQNPSQSSAQAIQAGTDVECGSEYKNLPEAVRVGMN